MNLYAGLFDYIVFGLLIGLNIVLWRKKISTKVGCIMSLLIFGVFLPLTSIAFELRSFEINTVYKPFDDSFETFYTLFRIPIYWSSGIVQVALLALKNRNKQKGKATN